MLLEEFIVEFVRRPIRERNPCEFVRTLKAFGCDCDSIHMALCLLQPRYNRRVEGSLSELEQEVELKKNVADTIESPHGKLW